MNIIRQIIGECHVALIKTKRNKKIINLLEAYLLNGVYKNTPSFDCIYKKDILPRVGKYTFTATDEKPLSVKIALRLFNVLFKYTINSSKKVFGGTEVIISSSLSEYKAFDYEKRRVLTVYKSVDKMEKVENYKQLFSEIYNVPTTYTFCREKSYVIEDLVCHSYFDPICVVQTIAEGICSVIEKYGYEKRNYEFFKTRVDHFSKRFGESNILYDDSLIICYTHGDLWSSNVIYNGEHYFVTDFELADSRFFLYDFFLFIFSEWLLKNDSRLLDCYFSGEYDSLLHKIFQTAKVNFDKHKKQIYIMTFLVSITYERWQTNIEMDSKINNFINHYILLY